MKFLMKIIFLGVLVSLAFYLFGLLKNDSSKEPQEQALQSEKILSFSFESKFPKIKIREQEKITLKNWSRKIKDLIYRKATEINPPGDVMPDEIDDKIIEKIQEEID